MHCTDFRYKKDRKSSMRFKLDKIMLILNDVLKYSSTF